MNMLRCLSEVARKILSFFSPINEQEEFNDLEEENINWIPAGHREQGSFQSGNQQVRNQIIQLKESYLNMS